MPTYLRLRVLCTLGSKQALQTPCFFQPQRCVLGLYILPCCFLLLLEKQRSSADPCFCWLGGTATARENKQDPSFAARAAIQADHGAKRYSRAISDSLRRIRSIDGRRCMPFSPSPRARAVGPLAAALFPKSAFQYIPFGWFQGRRAGLSNKDRTFIIKQLRETTENVERVRWSNFNAIFSELSPTPHRLILAPLLRRTQNRATPGPNDGEWQSGRTPIDQVFLV